MNIKIFIAFLFFTGWSFNTPSQNKSSVSVNKNSFELSLENIEYRFSDEQKNNFTIRDYYEYTNESLPGTYKLPSREIIVAIPPQSLPKISLTSTKEKKYYNILPVLNPAVELLNDSSVALKPIEFSQRIKSNDTKLILENLGFFWYRDFYCVHLKVNTHQYDETQSMLTEISDIKIKLEFEGAIGIESFSPIEIKSAFDESAKMIIANANIAEQFRGTPKLLISDTTGNWINYSSNYLKIGTVDDGLFRITKQDLQNFGISTNGINPRTFQLFESGVEKPIHVFGEDDLSFDDTDFIEFYGTKNYSKISPRVINANNNPYNNFLDKYSDTTVYFLTWGNIDGQRALQNDVFIGSLTDTITYYTSFTHLEENLRDNLTYTFHNDLVESQFPFWDTGKAWYWMWMATWANNRVFNFNMSDIVPNKQAKFYCKFSSFSSNRVSKVHLLQLFVNQVRIDSQLADRYSRILLNGSINSNSLINGNNVLKVTYNEASGAGDGAVLLDWVEAEYPRKLKLTSDSLYFEFSDIGNPALRLIKIGDVSSTDFLLFKVKPAFQRVTAYTISDGSLYFSDTVNNGDAYYLVKQNLALKPIFFKYKTFVNLRSQTNQADYIGITHPVFYSSVANYVDFVSNNFSVTTDLYLVEDIYDEFGYGYPTAESIRDFIEYKFQSSTPPKPSYLVLFGDANYDYKKYRYLTQGIIGGGNYVPSFGYPVSDQYYTIWNSSSPQLPQMYVGRIPINKSIEMEYYKSKVQNNLEKPFNDWNKKYLFFSGGRANYPDEIQIYKFVNDSVINNYVNTLPLKGKFTHFYKTVNPLTDFGPYSEAAFQNTIDAGGVFISYIGHSGTATWDNSISDVRQLKDKINRNPIVSDFGCSTNKFAEPDIVSFGERFVVDQDGQALGYVGNSALGFYSTAVNAPGKFYKSIIQDSIYQVGKAHVNAKNLMFLQFGNSSVVKQFSYSNTLIGDPIVEIRIPSKPNLIISNKDIIFESNLINDAVDSIQVELALNNYGTVLSTPFKLSITHTYRDTLINEISLIKNLPSFSDTINFLLPVHAKPGQHKLEVKLDTENVIDEIYKNDNSTIVYFNVASSSVRDLITNRYANPKLDSLIILSPSSNLNKQLKLVLQSSQDENFGSYQEKILSLDTFATKINLGSLSAVNRVFSRYKLEDAVDWSVPFSYSTAPGSKFFLSDDYSFNKQQLNKLWYNNNGIELVLDTITLSIISAGGYSGQYCIITKNGINLLSNTFFQGIGIAVFDETTLKVDTAAWFEFFNNQAVANAFGDFVSSIPPNKLVALGVSGDAMNNNYDVVKDAVRSLGGTRIDSLEFKAPYSLFGKKGADSTQVKQFIKNPFEGPIQADTILFRTRDEGSFVTDQVGPSSKWKKLKISQNTPNNSEVTYLPFGIKPDGTIDTLTNLTFVSNEMDLSSVSAAMYPYIKIHANFKPDYLLNSPNLSKFEVDYDGIAELGTNFQSVKTDKDTLEQGEFSKLSFFVFNSGEAQAENFRVAVSVLKENNSQLSILDSLISMEAKSKKYFETTYPTTFESGERLFKISIDDSSKVFEYYKDNNIYLTSIFIKPDTTIPTLIVTFDGLDIVNGDYVSHNPIILMELNDISNLPIIDTSSVTIFLDEKPIYFAQNQNTLSYKFNSANPKMVVEFKPLFNSGEHELKVFANDGFGNIADSSGLLKRFFVSNETQILNVFNYPNPIKQHTHFTFRLTQVPDQIRILVYTIAGRLVKEISKKREELTTDFNKIFWDCTDADGDLLGNGTYLYKIIMQKGDKTEASVHKLAIVR